MTVLNLPDPSSPNAPFLFVGLGNPGPEYRHNRHNVGFMALDRLAARLKIAFTRLESKALVTKTDYQGHKLVLAKPHTFMNLSGQAAGALIRYYRIPLSNVMVAYDDVDLPLATLRLRPDGGSAGQKGMGSIIERLGTQMIPRLRIGIGRPPGRMEAASYVLQDFSPGESDILNQALDRAVEAMLIFVSEGLEAAMNKYNGSI
jgi:peptidyl-tRNA hydrolase, PTH1 family